MTYGAPIWEIWLCDPTGTRLALLDMVSTFQVNRVVNDISVFEMTLPGDFDDSLLRIDGLVEFWRGVEGNDLKLFNVYFIRYIAYHDEDEVTEAITVRGYDATELLNRRIVAAYAGTDEARKTDNAGDIIKAFVEENLGGDATDSDRDLSDYITVQPDLADGASLTKGASWRSLLTVCQEIAAASETAGTPLYFGFEPVFGTTGITFDFRTYEGQPGQDHSTSGEAPVYFGKSYGNLSMSWLIYDYGEQVTVVYAGGQGDKEAREIVEVENAEQSGLSIWNRRERFINAVGEETTAAVTSRANAALRAGEVLARFAGNLLDSDETRYGVDWAWGDLVRIKYRDKQFNGLVRMVDIWVDSSGKETINVRVEVESDV